MLVAQRQVHASMMSTLAPTGVQYMSARMHTHACSHARTQTHALIARAWCKLLATGWVKWIVLEQVSTTPFWSNTCACGTQAWPRARRRGGAHCRRAPRGLACAGRDAGMGCGAPACCAGGAKRSRDADALACARVRAAAGMQTCVQQGCRRVCVRVCVQQGGACVCVQQGCRRAGLCVCVRAHAHASVHMHGYACACVSSRLCACVHTAVCGRRRARLRGVRI